MRRSLASGSLGGPSANNRLLLRCKVFCHRFCDLWCRTTAHQGMGPMHQFVHINGYGLHLAATRKKEAYTLGQVFREMLRGARLLRPPFQSASRQFVSRVTTRTLYLAGLNAKHARQTAGGRHPRKDCWVAPRWRDIVAGASREGAVLDGRGRVASKLGRSSTSRGCGANSRMRRRSASFCIRMRISCTITSSRCRRASITDHGYASWSSGKAASTSSRKRHRRREPGLL